MEDSDQPVPDSDSKINFLTDSLTDLKEVGDWTLRRQTALFEKISKTTNNANIVKCYKKIVKTINTLNKSLSDITAALDIAFKKWALENGYDKKACEVLCSNILKGLEKSDEICESRKSSISVEENSIILSSKNIKFVEPVIKVDKEVVNKYLETSTSKSNHKNKSIYECDTDIENTEIQNTKAETSDYSNKQQDNIKMNGEKKKQKHPKKSSNNVLGMDQTTENVSDSKKDTNDQRDEEKNTMENCETHEISDVTEEITFKDRKHSDIIKKVDKKIRDEKQKSVEKDANDSKKNKRKKSKNRDSLNEQVESESRNKEIDKEEDKNENSEICDKTTEKRKGDESNDESIVMEKDDGSVSQIKTIGNVDLQIEDAENECVESRNKNDSNDSEIGNVNDNTDITLDQTKENETVQTERAEDTQKKIESKDKITERELKNKSESENNLEIDENGDGKRKNKEVAEIVESKKQKDKMKNKKTNEKNDIEKNVELSSEKENAKNEEIDEEVEFENQGNKNNEIAMTLKDKGKQLEVKKESQNCEIDKNGDDESKKEETIEDEQNDKKNSKKNDTENNVELVEEKEKSRDKNKESDEEEVEFENEGKKECETQKDKSKELQIEKKGKNSKHDKNEVENKSKKNAIENVEDEKQTNKKKIGKTNEKDDTETNIELNEEKEISKDKLSKEKNKSKDEINKETEKSKEKSKMIDEEIEKQENKDSGTTKTKDDKLENQKTKIDVLDEEGEKDDPESSILARQNSTILIDSSFEGDMPLADCSKEENKSENEPKNEKNIKTEVDDKGDKKVGIIRLVDITKLVDRAGFILSPTREQEDHFKNEIKDVPEKSKKRKSVSFLVEDSNSSDNKAKPKMKQAQVEPITISSDSSDFESKTSSKKRATRNRASVSKSKTFVSTFDQLRKLREERYKKRRVTVESDSSDSDNSSKLSKEVKQYNRKEKQLKCSDKSDPKFHLSCSVVIEKLDLSKPEIYLKRYLDLKEAKSVQRLSDVSSLKKRKRNAKKASSDASDSVSSGSEKLKSKRSRASQKKKSESESESDEEMPLGNLKKKVTDDSDGGSEDDAPLKSLKDQVDVPKNNVSEPESVNSPSGSEDESPETNKKKKESSKKKSTNNENKSGSDTEKNNGTEKKNVKNKEDVDSEDSDFQKKKSWKKDKLLHGKLSDSGSSDEDKDKKNKSQKKKKRNRRVLGSDSEAHSDDGSDEEFEPKKDKKSDSDNSSEDSDGDVSKKKKHRRIKKINDSDDSSENEYEDGESGKRRKKIRAVLKDDLLSKTTRDAAKEEQERKRRISDRQKMYNEMYDLALENKAKVDKVVLDFDPDTKKELIKVHPKLVEKLKPHQANGVKFMWDACFESLEQTKKDKGSGCILAHCMGLGKTLQVVALVHTLLTHKKTGVRTVMVVCPLSTVLNWVNEFKIWLDSINDGEDVNVFEISRYKKNFERAYQIKDWQECGGVLILGYEMFRLLSNDANKRIRKKNRDSLQSALVDPGPDLVVCDEGHLLKNEKSRLSKAMNCLKTMRRIVLTGTPVQNNLKEYYCMVQFVKPNLLGKYNEYTNRFVNPITNGQYTDSTPRDIAIMKRRSHVLHKLLDGVVQRRDYAVLAPFLPPKHEYVCFLSLTPIQKKLYQIYMDHQSKRAESGGKAVALFADFQALQRIWTHPRMLKAYSEKYEKDQEKKAILSDEEHSLDDFIDDDETSSTSESEAVSTSDDNSDASIHSVKKKKTTSKRRTRASAAQSKDNGDESDSDDVQEIKPPNPTEWWCDHIKEDELDNLKYSAKLLLLFDILKKCEQIGDKVLVFSQSLYSLDLIEYFLEKIDEATQNGDSTEELAGHNASWTLGLDYFRLDGSSSVENRAAWCKSFNDEDNPRARLFLISTKAGGLGINLVAANRVIIFDVSWNPSHDVQSIFRIYRFGQKKPCYVYRFIAMGTMEEKVYERQVTKQAISKRVIDEQQIDRHYNQNDLAELYKFTPEPEGERPIPMLPKDRMFAELLQEHENLIYRYHEHDSLLENKEEEELDEDERRAAWDEFENEKTAKPAPGLMGSMIRPSMTPEQAAYALEVMLRNEHPLWTDIQIRQMVPAILQQMYQQAIAGDWTLYNRVMSYQVTLQQQVMAAQTRLMNPALQTVIAANQKAKESQWAAMVKRMQMGAASRPSTSKETRPTPTPRPFDPNEVVNLD